MSEIQLTMYVIEQIIICNKQITIKKTAYQALEVEFRDAQKYINKLSQEKIASEKTKEKYMKFMFLNNFIYEKQIFID